MDLLVKDIYGEHELDAIGLSGDTIASSFGKVAREARRAEGEKRFAPEDITRSLLIMICNVSANQGCKRIEEVEYVEFRRAQDLLSSLEHGAR